MTTPVNTNTTDIPIFLDEDLLTSTDDQCPFSSDAISEQPEDIVTWLDINDKQMVLSNDNMIGIKPELLLNQIDVRDSPTLMHLSDMDVFNLGDISSMDILENSESDCFVQKSSDSKTDRNMNSVLKRVQSEENKCDILENIVNLGLTVEIIHLNNKLRVILQNKINKEVFPCHFILATDSGHINQGLIKQPVELLEKTTIALDLDIKMPCLHTKLGLRVWFCPLNNCCRAFYRFNVAKLHSLQHLHHKPFKCEFPNCEWAFYTSNKLRRHQETHSKRKDFLCSFTDCNRRFTTIYNLNWHKHRCHERPAPFMCSVASCNERFQTVRARELHLKCHGQEEAPYRCPASDCNKSFFMYTALIAHSRIHTHKESELSCQWPNCGRKFVQPCRLKQHTLQHTGQRPFMCTFEKCKWAFSTSSKLKRHLSTHTKERKFHCTMGSCSKSFVRSEHLKDHTLTHIGQRSFHCEECNISFTGKSGLYLHTKRCHPKADEKCVHAVQYQQQNREKQTSDDLLEQAIRSLDVPSDMMLGTNLLPEEPLELLENEHFSTVNLRDLE